MRALVLSGGSIKGAFQAGAIAEILERGFRPEVIYGTSVGSLNGGFIADRVGSGGTRPPDWAAIGRSLQEFWLDRVTSFRRLGRKRGALELLWSIMSRRFDGLLDMSRLYALIHDTLKPENIAMSAVGFYACAVNLATGEAVYAEKADPNIVQYIIASTAIPLVMPITMIGAEPFWDGGIREVAPLRRAIEESRATEIVCIACDPARIGGAAICGSKGPLMGLAGRLMDIVVAETLSNDLEVARSINQYLEENADPRGRLAAKRRIDLVEIRPGAPLTIDLETFSRPDIAAVLELGRQRAAQAWESREMQTGSEAPRSGPAPTPPTTPW